MGALNDLKDDAVAYGKGMVKFLTPTDENNQPIKFSPEIDTKPKTVGVEHAQSEAAKTGDTVTAASTVGVHPIESHFAPTGRRHQLGRGVPKS